MLLFVCAIVCTCVTAYYASVRISDSDAASELVLGNLLARQNRIITTDWYYSTEIRMVNTNLVYLALFKVLDNWHTVRFAASLVFVALLAGSYCYFCRQLKISRQAFFLSAALLVLPVNVFYGKFILYHSYYAPLYIYGFLIAGLTLAYVVGKGDPLWKQRLRLGSALILSMISCMNGLRQLPATMLPLLLTAFALLAKERGGKTPAVENDTKRLRTMIRVALGIFMAGLIGTLVYDLALVKLYSARSSSYLQIDFPTAEQLRNLVVGYVSLFGFQTGRTLFSIEGVLALCGAGAALLMLYLSAPYCTANERLSSPAKAFAATGYPVALLGITLLFLFVSGNENYPQYYLLVFLWVFPFLGVQLDQMEFSKKALTLKQLSVLAVCCCMLANGLFYSFYYVRPGNKQVVYDAGIPVNTVSILQGAVDYITENHLDIGYATFWQANIITEETNGTVPMISVSYHNEDHTIRYYDWLTNQNDRDRASIEGKSVFIIVKFTERDDFAATELAQYATLAYEQAYCSIYTFADPLLVWHYLQAQEQVSDEQSAYPGTPAIAR